MNSDLSQIPIGDPEVWDFSYRYNLYNMDDTGLAILRMKYEKLIMIRRAKRDHEKQYFLIQEILGKIYREIMNRARNQKLNQIINDREVRETVQCASR